MGHPSRSRSPRMSWYRMRLMRVSLQRLQHASHQRLTCLWPAAPHIRLRALAVLESDEPEGSTANASAGNARFGLSLPARRGRRMRVLLTSASGKRSSRIPHAESQNAGAMLQQAQDEAFDEEVFEQILGEARSMQLLDARISMERVTFRPAPDLELSFEMVREPRIPGEWVSGLLLTHTADRPQRRPRRTSARRLATGSHPRHRSTGHASNLSPSQSIPSSAIRSDGCSSFTCATDLGHGRPLPSLSSIHHANDQHPGGLSKPAQVDRVCDEGCPRRWRRIGRHGLDESVGRKARGGPGAEYESGC